MSKPPQRKHRVDFRKNRAPEARRNDLTREHQSETLDLDRVQKEERVSGKGSRSRRRTVVGDLVEDDQIIRAVDESVCQRGRVLSAIGATIHETAPRGVTEADRQQQMTNARGSDKKPEPIRNRGEKVGRNDPCPCGSGKKYKNCHMRQTV